MKQAFICAFVVCLLSLNLSAQTSEFTYQGNLKDGASNANGNYEFEFVLFDSQAGGGQIGPTLSRTLAVADGIFSVKLEFGAVFPGAERYLEIRVRQIGQQNYSILSPRQLVNSVPYAVKAVNSSQLNGMAADQYVLISDPRMTDARPPTAGSASYIQNQNAGPQAASNFNVSGNGTANLFNSLTQYNIGGDRILSIAGNSNAFLGRDAGIANTTGSGNAIFGSNAGQTNNTGAFNAFFGRNSGRDNVAGSFNSYFGESSGITSTGNNNSFFGSNTGFNNTTGNNITLIGQSANVTADGLTNATAIGFRAAVGQSNSLVLGSINGINTAVADTNVGIGTTTPLERLHVVGNGLFTGNLTVNGSLNVPGLGGQFIQNTTIPQASSNFNISGNGNLGGSLTAGAGVSGFSSNSNGVFGTSANSSGVYGSSDLGTGVTGFSQSNIGIYGSSPSGTAGYFDGIVQLFRDSSAATNFQSSQLRIRGKTNNLSQLALGFDTTANVGVIQAYEVLAGPKSLLLNPNGGSVGIGTTSPQLYRLHVEGGSDGGVRSNSTASAGLLGTSTNSYGVYGSNTGPMVTNISGIRGDSTNNYGVFGISTNLYGVRGESTNNYGVYGYSPGVTGVYGFSPTGVGVFGTSNSSYGVRGLCASCVGVYGSSTSNYGGYFDTGSGNGLYAHSTGGYGIFARSENTHAIYAEGSVRFNRWIQVDELRSGGGATVCWNAAHELSSCASSSIRYKKNIDDFNYGMSVVRKLRPVTFDWKVDGSHDVGLVAEDVEKIAPLLTVTNKAGQVEGVRYEKLGIVLINAVKEQQAQIESHQKQIIELRKLVCELKPQANICNNPH